MSECWVAWSPDGDLPRSTLSVCHLEKQWGKNCITINHYTYKKCYLFRRQRHYTYSE